MTLTTYGYKLPASGDLAKGTSGWFKMLEYNISRLDGHTHDGANSALIPPSSFAPYSGTILASGWAADGAGFKQTVAVPAGIAEVSDYNLKFVFTAPAAALGFTGYISYKRLTATTYEVYCNDTTAAFTVTYR